MSISRTPWGKSTVFAMCSPLSDRRVYRSLLFSQGEQNLPVRSMERNESTRCQQVKRDLSVMTPSALPRFASDLDVDGLLEAESRHRWRHRCISHVPRHQ